MATCSTVHTLNINVALYLFADVIVLFALSWQQVQPALEVFHSVATSFSLTVSFIKTKDTACSTGLPVEDCLPIPVADESVANVQ